jgi:hypothetical protein
MEEALVGAPPQQAVPPPPNYQNPAAVLEAFHTAFAAGDGAQPAPDARTTNTHPERAYVAPSTVGTRVDSDSEGFEGAMVFEYTLRLPPGLSGELVLLQWYYVASNLGCVHEGYAEYDFPREWIKSLDSEGEGDGEPSAWEEKFSVGTGLKSCDEVLSEDGVSSFVNGLYCYACL